MGSGKKPYFYFITFLRALAAIVITNSHYVGIYPTDMIANGGLLGDVMFFSVSGFCLASPKLPFYKWYPKRLWRIYVAVWIITSVYVLLGAYPIHSLSDALISFILPTKYHFIASITLLYLPLYFVAKYIKLSTKNYIKIGLALLAVQLLIYTIYYDTSYYHIDNVREPMIEFLFFQAMLLGLYFRRRCSFNLSMTKQGRFTRVCLPFVLFSMLGVYFASKLLFVKNLSLSNFQILNQVILFALLFILFQFVMKNEMSFQKLEGGIIWKIITFLSDHTLEIYLVQSVIIGFVLNLKLTFPLNWIVTTTMILVAATILRWISQKIVNHVNL